jgi:hypothetical protein
MNQDYTDVCPLLDRPPGGRENYLQPVQVDRNVQLVTRNLPPEVKGVYTDKYATIYVCLEYGPNFSCRYLVLITHVM